MLTVVPVGYVVGGRSAPVDDDWDAVTATIRLDATRFDADALRGLAAFSHLEVLYHFHLVARTPCTRARAARAATRPGRSSASSRSAGRTARTGSASRPAGSRPWSGSRP